MMAPGWAESTWEMINCGRFINQFSSDIMIDTETQRINKKYVDKICL